MMSLFRGGSSVDDNRPWMTLFGELRELRKETALISQIIEQEFERIEPNDQPMGDGGSRDETRLVEWSDEWSDEDLADATRSALLRLEKEEEEQESDAD